jgi:hypothetical protein
MPKTFAAKLAAEKAVFDALLYDRDFSDTAKSLYRSGNKDALNRMLVSVISNEIKMEISDMLFNTENKYAFGEDRKLTGQRDLPLAIEMVESGRLDLVNVYRNADGLLEMMLGMLRHNAEENMH